VEEQDHDTIGARGQDLQIAENPNSGELNRLLQILCDLDGSDLHIKGESPHSVRVDGHLHTLDSEPPISAEDALALAEAIMPPNIRAIFWDKHEADFAYSVNGVGRFRINAFYQRGSVALAIRRVRTSTASIEELGLPDVVRRWPKNNEV
jgi:twitching motility protein PilT